VLVETIGGAEDVDIVEIEEWVVAERGEFSVVVVPGWFEEVGTDMDEVVRVPPVNAWVVNIWGCDETGPVVGD